MSAWKTKIALIGLGVLVGLNQAEADPVGTSFSYQAHAEKDGEPLNDTCDLRFTAYDAEEDGTAVGGPVEVLGVVVTDGLLTGEVDFGTGVFAGEARWLAIELKCTGDADYVLLEPRQELRPTPYSIGLGLPFSASYDEPGSVFSVTNVGGGRAANFQISNVASAAAAINVLTNGTGPAGRFLNDAGGYAIEAIALGPADAVRATSPTVGVFGESTAAGGMGVRGETNHESAIGVLGKHSAGSGTAPGVQGESNSTAANAAAVLGKFNHGILGVDAAAVRGEVGTVNGNGYGVYGRNNGDGVGVFGRANDEFGIGVKGESDNGVGVHGETHSTFNNKAGVRGVATGSAGTRGVTTYGVYGESLGGDGVGVKGVHVAVSGIAPGVLGESASQEDGATGVMGRATATPTGIINTYGVWGESSAQYGVGVYGVANTGVWGQTDDGHGVHGTANPSGTAVYAGGFGSARALWAETTLGTGTAVTALAGDGTAIFAESDGLHAVRGKTNSSTAYGGYFINNTLGGVALYASGQTAIRTSGDVEINGQASAEVIEITGADLAEKFPLSEPVEPGMVVAIDPANPGKLCLSREAYNKRVAGVISGANELCAGVVLGNQPGSESHQAVALSGRVWVHCDATQHGIEPGDFLTTADRSGYAMPVLDKHRAAGAIIGKAMTDLERGRTGLVLVLVNLQ